MSNPSRERKCCDDILHEHNSSGHLLSNMQSPLQVEMKKYQLEASRMVGRVPFIPFLDDGDATFTVLNNLLEVSPTHGACKDKFKKYMRPFDNIAFKRSMGLFLNEQQAETPITLSEFQEFQTALIDIFGEKGLMDLSDAINREIENYLAYGNNIIELILTENGQARMAKLFAYDFGMFRYENSNNPEDLGKYGYLCEDFKNVNYNMDVKYQRYSMYPLFEEWPDGTLRCLIHTKDLTAGRHWYGIPFTFPSIYPQFMEFQAGKYTSVAMDNKFLASMIIETESPQQDIKTPAEEEAAARRKKEQFKQIYTNKGADNADQFPVVSMTRPFGAGPTVFKDIVSNFDADSHKLMYEVSEKQIMLSWGIHEAIFNQGGSSLSGGNFFYEIALNFYYTSIQPAVDKCLSAIQIAIKEAQKWVGYDNPNNLAITLPMPEFINKLKPAAEPSATTTQPQI